MPEIRQPVGDAILSVLGLDRSLLPRALLNLLRARLDQAYTFTLAVSVRPDVPCPRAATTPAAGAGGAGGASPGAGSQPSPEGGEGKRRRGEPAPRSGSGRRAERAGAGGPTRGEEPAPAVSTRPARCCRILINPGRDPWPTPSPKLSGGRESRTEISASITGIGSISLVLSLKATPEFIEISPRGNCPDECRDESLTVRVVVNVEGEAAISGQILSLDAPQPTLQFAPTEADLGPVFGKVSLAGNGDIPAPSPAAGGPGVAALAGGGAGLAKKVSGTSDSYAYSVVCDSITRVLAPSAPPGGPAVPHGAPGTSGLPPSGPGTSAPAAVPRDPGCPNPDVGRMLADTGLRGALEQLWRKSRPNAAEVGKNQPGSKKVEWGCWIILNAKTGRYRIEERGPGTRDEVDMGSAPAVKPPECIMATFHTHPNTRAEGYEPDASVTDVVYYNRHRFPDGRRVPMIIRSHEGYHSYADDF